jgi:hypothetical protein
MSVDDEVEPSAADAGTQISRMLATQANTDNGPEKSPTAQPVADSKKPVEPPAKLVPDPAAGKAGPQTEPAATTASTLPLVPSQADKKIVATKVRSKPKHKLKSKPKKSSHLKRRRRVAHAQTGTLVLSSDPWAYVEVDGKRLSEPTPIAGLKLKAGVHRIRLFNPAAKLSRTIRVKIKANQTTRRVVRF